MKKVKISPNPRYDSIPVNKDENLGKITRSKSLSSPKKDMAPILKYRATKYTKVFVEQANNDSPTYYYEIEGIRCQSRGGSRGTYYFDCSSKRLMNAPDCAFRGRVVDFKQNQIEGDIEIIKEHSSTCQFKPGNSLYDFQKNSNLRSDTRNYKTMKIEIEKS